MRLLQILFLVMCLSWVNLWSAEDITAASLREAEQLFLKGDQDKQLIYLDTIIDARGPRTLQAASLAMAAPSEAVRERAYNQVVAHPPEILRPALEKMLRHSQEFIRAAGIRLMVDQFPDEAWGVLKKIRIDREKSSPVRLAYIESVGKLPYLGDDNKDGRMMLTSLAAFMVEEDPSQRIEAINAIGPWAATSEGAKNALLLGVKNNAEEMAWKAGFFLAEANAQEHAGIQKGLEKLVKDRDRGNRVAAAIIHSQINSSHSIDALLRLTQDKKWDVACAAIDAIGIIAPDDETIIAQCEDVLIPFLDAKEWGLRNCSAWTLARLGSSQAVPKMIQNAGRESDDLIIHLLGHMIRRSDLETKAQLEAWMGDQDPNAIDVQRVGELKTATSVEFYSINDETESVCFILDTSGSMRKRKRMDLAKDELWDSVHDLSVLTRFNIVFFDSIIKAWRDVPLVATWRNKALLRDYLPRVSPNGATNTYAALTKGIDLYGVETLFLLTDGMPTEGKTSTPVIIELITYANKLKKVMRNIHTIAFHLPEGAAFLKELSDQNGGTNRLVE